MNTPHKPRKRFGQNFLTDPAIIQQIINTINPQSSQHLVEIGPGEGVLTEHLITGAKQLDAIEIDRDLIKLLTKRFPTLHLYNQDVLEFDFLSLVQPGEKLRVTGNLPYNISTPLIFHLFKYLEHISDMSFMLQKEVVQRLCAPVGDKHYNRLSVMSQYFCQSEYLFEIPPHAFNPPPKVMSAFVRMTPRLPEIEAIDLALFGQVVKSAFTYRRKTLTNSLKGLVNPDTLRTLNIEPKKRAQELTVAEYVKISNHLAKH